jgi:beta-glucanase (GH16 family)
MRFATGFLSFFLLFSCMNEFNTLSLNKGTSSTSSRNISTQGTVSTQGTCDYDLAETTLTSNGWTKVFDEQFSNLNAWNIWTGGAYNNELQYYQSANLVLKNNDLNIVAKSQKITGSATPGSSTMKNFNYTSGRIESTTLYSACATTPRVRLVARIKLPAGYGMWPAFWSYGDPWPTEGEIDILESRGQEPTTYSTNYFYGTVANKNLVSNATTTINTNVSLQTCWHVYELIWEQNKLTFLLDGVIVDTKTGGYVSSLYGKKEKITLNLAVGGNYFTRLVTRNIVPGTMQIDYVKVFTSS